MTAPAMPASSAARDAAAVRFRYAVVGHPVEHSQSPFIHACFAQDTGEPVDYDRVLSPLDGFAATVRAFAAHGCGCNVTVPFKFEAHALAVRHSPRATLAGAANVLRFDDDGWYADNTDGAGLVRDLEVNAARPLSGRRVLLVGAGGAAAGALGALLLAAPAEVHVSNRHAERAVALVERHAGAARSNGVHLTASDPTGVGTAYDIVINATASSLHGDAVPIAASTLSAHSLALDMMYGPGAELFLQWARTHGAQARDGLGMLVEQAAESFAVWRGVRPATGEVLRRLRERVAGTPASPAVPTGDSAGATTA